MQLRVVSLTVLVLVVSGCSSEDGDRDLAGAATGPATEIHCQGEKRQVNLERFPTTVGSTSVDVACQGTQP